MSDDLLVQTSGPEQLSLIDGESDEALLVPIEKAQKMFTGATVAKQELKRNYILDMLAWGFPVETIEQKAGTNRTVVRLLGAKFAEQLAANGQQFARLLKTRAARWAMLADQKADTAKFSELVIGAGIMAQRGQEADLASAPLDDLNAGAIDVQSDDPALASAREFVKKLAEKSDPQTAADLTPSKQS